MKRLRKILLGVLIFFVIAILVTTGVVHQMARKSIPDYHKNITVQALQSEVTVIRDQYAIPHIYASNEEDLYFAVGYILAQDRMWQMDLLRRVTTGRLSEIFGEDFVETDLFLRALRIPEKSRMIIDTTDQHILRGFERFMEGVNQYLEDNRKRLPFEFTLLGYEPEPWTIEHSFNIIGYMAWDLANAAYSTEVSLYKIGRVIPEERIQDLFPHWRNREECVYPEFSLGKTDLEEIASLLAPMNRLKDLGVTVFDGSNNWAVSGAKSVTGKPLLANDMHLGLSAPGIWYQMHQVVKGKLNVSGVVVPGQPLVIAGHNNSIAWGLTNLYVDDIDIYKETLHPEKPGLYKFNGEWRKMEIRKEIIKTKEGKEITKELKFTHRGPVISGFREIKDEVLSMRWVGNDYSNEVRSVYLLNRAKNWKDFQKALETFQSISQNFVYADVNGNIGMYAGGGVPIRKGDGLMIRPGETDEYDWNGKVPFHLLPHSYNPEKNYVASANNKTVHNDYPFYIGSLFSHPSRYNRIVELLNEKPKLSVEDFKAMQNDQTSYMVKQYLPVILNELKQEETRNETEQEIIALFEGWDGNMMADLVAPAIFEMMYLKLPDFVLRDELGEVYPEFSRNRSLTRDFIERLFQQPENPWVDNIHTDKKETFHDIIMDVFRESLAELSETYGDNPSGWKWGKIHRLTIEHPLGKVEMLNRVFRLNKGPFETGGSNHTVCPYSYSADFHVVHGASQRHIYDLSDWDKSLTIIPTGNCGIPASRHYCDQTEMYVKGQYHEENFSHSKVMENKVYEMKFFPGK